MNESCSFHVSFCKGLALSAKFGMYLVVDKAQIASQFTYVLWLFGVDDSLYFSSVGFILTLVSYVHQITS